VDDASAFGSGRSANVREQRVYTILYPTVAMTTGGAEQQLLELVRGLDKRRFRPIVAPLHRGGTRDAELNSMDGIDVVYLDRSHKFDFSPIWKLVRLLRERHVNIVQPFVSPASFFGLLAGMIAGTPVKIATERGGVRRAPGLGGRLYLFAASKLLRFVDVAVANSEAGRQMLRRDGISDSRIMVVANGVSFDRLDVSPERVAQHRQRLGADSTTPVIGILATLKPAKGQDTYLRAAAEIARHHPTARFAVVGDGPLRADLEALARDLGISHRVTFFGNQQRVADFLSLFDVLVSASRDNEGHSNSILEAMAVGVPVVATNIGGSRELVEHGRTGLLVPPDDHGQIASAVEVILDDPDAASAMAARARALVDERFGLERMVSEYASLYERLLLSVAERPVRGGQLPAERGSSPGASARARS
jgi:glycosyltransferase involved in cell wall biosynthesis